jgi:hypothetical protein
MAGGFPEWRYDPRLSQHAAGSCSGLTARRGRILFQCTPGTAPASASGMYVGQWSNLSANYISLYFSGATEITLKYYDLGASARSDTWTCTGSMASGTAYEIKIEYNRTFMKLYVDNDLKITLSYDVDFGSAVPDYFTLGTDIDAANTYTSTTYDLADMRIYDYQGVRQAG